MKRRKSKQSKERQPVFEATLIGGGVYSGLEAIYKFATMAVKFLVDNNFIGFMSNRSLAGIVKRAAPRVGKGLQGIVGIQQRMDAVTILCVELGGMDSSGRTRLLAAQADGSIRNIVGECFEHAIVFGNFSIENVAVHDELSRNLARKIEESRRGFKI